MPSCNTYRLGFLLPWTWDISSRLLQQSAAAAPYFETVLSRKVLVLLPSLGPHHPCSSKFTFPFLRNQYLVLSSLEGQQEHAPFQITLSKALDDYGAGGGLAAELCPLFVTPWTAAHQSPLSMRLPRQEYWSGLPFPSLEDLPDPEIEPVFSRIARGFFTN